jgi:MFS family permease
LVKAHHFLHISFHFFNILILGLMVNHFAAFFIALATGTFYGCFQSICSGIILEEPWVNFSEVQKGLISSSVLWGGLVGCFFGGFISDAIGPKFTIFLSGVLSFICAGGLCVQKNFVLLLVIRAISGIGVGVISGIGPLYIGEQSSAERRGALVAFYQLCICLGILIDFLINYLFALMPAGV